MTGGVSKQNSACLFIIQARISRKTRKENKFIRVNLCLKDRNKGTLHAFRRRPIILFHVISGN